MKAQRIPVYTALIATALLIAFCFIGCDHGRLTEVLNAIDTLEEPESTEQPEPETAPEVILLPVGAGKTGINFHPDVDETHIRYIPHHAVEEDDEEED